MSIIKKSNLEEHLKKARNTKQALKSESPLSEKDEQDKVMRQSAQLQKQAKENWDELQKKK